MSTRSIAPYLSALAAAVLAVAAAGCGATDPDPGDDLDGEACQATADCPGNQTCQKGYCTVRSAELEAVRFQFIPPQSSGYSPQTTRGVTVRTERWVDFALEPNVAVNGQISFDQGGNSGVDGPSGPLTFKRKRRDDTLFDVQTRVDEGDFEAMVLPGKYDLLFAPADYPSRVWRNRSFTANAELADLSVPVKRDLATVQGRIVFEPEQAASSNENHRGVGSAHVLGVSADGRFTTTIDTTSEGGGDEQMGRFALRAFPGTGPYDLVINPGAESVLPKVRVPDAFAIDADGSEEFLSDEATNLGTYPSIPSASRAPTFSMDFALPEGVSEGDVDWTRIQVVAHAHTDDLGGDGVTREFRRETTADSEGRVELTLLPARYTVRVYPPAESPLASTTLEVDVTDEAVATFGDWKVKRELEGRVVDSTGRPVPDARLDFWPNGHSDAGVRDRLKVSTTTDQDGAFAVGLEPRDHTVTVRPPSGSGLPRHRASVPRHRLVEGAEAELQLPEPLLLRGSVHGASTDRTTNAIEGTAVSASIKEHGAQRLLGKATTDAEGRFLMIVPATLK